MKKVYKIKSTAFIIQQNICYEKYLKNFPRGNKANDERILKNTIGHVLTNPTKDIWFVPLGIFNEKYVQDVCVSKVIEPKNDITFLSYYDSGIVINRNSNCEEYKKNYKRNIII